MDRSVVALALLSISTIAAADPNFGSYTLVKRTGGTTHRDDGSVPPSCGAAGRQRLAAISRVEVRYDGNVIVNGQRWMFDSVDTGTVSASSTDANGDCRLVLLFRREGRARARGSLMVIGINGKTITCTDGVSLDGSFTK